MFVSYTVYKKFSKNSETFRHVCLEFLDSGVSEDNFRQSVSIFRLGISVSKLLRLEIFKPLVKNSQECLKIRTACL